MVHIWWAISLRASIDQRIGDWLRQNYMYECSPWHPHMFFFIKLQSFKPLNYKGYCKNLWHCVIPKKWRWKDKPFVKYGLVYCNIWCLTQFFHNLDKRLFAIKTVSAFDSFTTVLKLNALNVQNYTLYVVNFTIAKGSQYPLKQVQRIISTQTHLIKS